jgi:hypothetical protein
VQTVQLNARQPPRCIGRVRDYLVTTTDAKDMRKTCQIVHQYMNLVVQQKRGGLRLNCHYVLTLLLQSVNTCELICLLDHLGGLILSIVPNFFWSSQEVHYAIYCNSEKMELLACRLSRHWDPGGSSKSVVLAPGYYVQWDHGIMNLVLTCALTVKVYAAKTISDALCFVKKLVDTTSIWRHRCSKHREKLWQKLQSILSSEFCAHTSKDDHSFHGITHCQDSGPHGIFQSGSMVQLELTTFATRKWYPDRVGTLFISGCKQFNTKPSVLALVLMGWYRVDAVDELYRAQGWHHLEYATVHVFDMWPPWRRGGFSPGTSCLLSLQGILLATEHLQLPWDPGDERHSGLRASRNLRGRECHVRLWQRTGPCGHGPWASLLGLAWLMHWRYRSEELPGEEGNRTEHWSSSSSSLSLSLVPELSFPIPFACF